ncbi:hypothetical protein HMPREF1549_02273 [Actinomyces johnsonii F0510]|uniref:Uncharacterized protein n=1 Tax=Actinomyces johnsonii F0510 TaxID=1227262 RepID=U1PP12_9ACTO|nr:hypothetical protein HMPREF1549_02273 [Actinomyces johnsonii F0510]
MAVPRHLSADRAASGRSCGDRRRTRQSSPPSPHHPMPVTTTLSVFSRFLPVPPSPSTCGSLPRP